MPTIPKGPLSRAGRTGANGGRNPWDRPCRFYDRPTAVPRPLRPLSLVRDPARRPVDLERAEGLWSEVLVRVRATDPDERMPPPDDHPALSPADISLLEQWIRAGAVFDPPWAFVPPQRPEAPQPSIDSFVAARRETEGIRPSPPAAADRPIASRGSSWSPR